MVHNGFNRKFLPPVGMGGFGGWLMFTRVALLMVEKRHSGDIISIHNISTKTYILEPKSKKKGGIVAPCSTSFGKK